MSLAQPIANAYASCPPAGAREFPLPAGMLVVDDRDVVTVGLRTLTLEPAPLT